MRLRVIGSGSSVPHAERTSSSYWIEASGQTLLLDCAPSAIHRVAAERLDWANLDAIWISHFHLDHVGGLAPLLFSTKYAEETAGRTKPMIIYGPAGLQNLLAQFDAAGDYGLLRQPFPLSVVEIQNEKEFEILPGLAAETFKTPHTKESRAIRLENPDGKSIVFTADTGFSDKVAMFAAGCDLFIAECSFIREKPVVQHLELADAISMILIAGPQRAMLTHFYPEWDNVDFGELTAGKTECEIIQAADGLELDIGD